MANFQESLLEESMLDDNIKMISDKGLRELELHVETNTGTNDCVKGLSGGIHRCEKQMVAKEISVMVGDIVEISFDIVDEIVILPTCSLIHRGKL